MKPFCLQAEGVGVRIYSQVLSPRKAVQQRSLRFRQLFDHRFQIISGSPWVKTADRVITSATVLTPLALGKVKRFSDGALTLLVRESGRFGSFDA